MHRTLKNINVDIQFVDGRYSEKESTAVYQQLFDLLCMIGRSTPNQNFLENPNI